MLIIKNILFETDSLNKLIQCDKLPVILSFKLRNHIKKYKELEQSYFEEKQKLINKYNISDNKGTPQFWKEMNQLLNIETEIQNDKMQININKLPDGLLSPADIINLENLFYFVEECEGCKNKKKKK